MSREDFLIIMAFLLIFESYIAGSVIQAISGFVLLAYLYSISSSANINVIGERVIESGNVFEEGEKIRVTVILKNLGEDVAIKIIERSPNFEVEFLNYGVVLKSGEEKKIEYILIPQKIGVMTLSPLKVVVYDRRYLYYKEFEIGKSMDIKIYPSNKWIKEAAKINHNLKISFNKTSSVGGFEESFPDNLRKYIPGDSFRRIDWKATVRVGELIVREFLKKSECPVYIILDNTQEMKKGTKLSKIDYGSILALQLATTLIRKFKVGLIIYSEDSAEYIPAKQGTFQLELIRQKLTPRNILGIISLHVPSQLGMGLKAQKFKQTVLRFKKRKSQVSGIIKAFSFLKEPAYVLLITDLNNPQQIYSILAKERQRHRILVLSPNPVLFYQGKMNKATLKKLYEAYIKREKMIKKFNTLVPTIDLGPSDYLENILKRERL